MQLVFYSLYFLLPDIIHLPQEGQLHKAGVFVFFPGSESMSVKTNECMFLALSHLVLPVPLQGYDTITVPVSQKRMLRLRDRKSLGQHHTAKRQQAEFLVQTQGFLALDPKLLIVMHVTLRAGHLHALIISRGPKAF